MFTPHALCTHAPHCAYMVNAAQSAWGAQASNWQLLSGVKWLRHVDTKELLPLVGELKFMFEQFIVPYCLRRANQLRELLRKLISGQKDGKMAACVDKLYTPMAAQALPSGSSLVDLSYETSSQQFVEEVRAAWGLQVGAR
eukprot:CAMPEP_0183348934 /NCGR_PEP_ID=MMETSP0164_2-20130417/13283_1 /TAXON_ID=221442 /ORGANISM="Coccolithus pelagicus ssp braarudi, Strain PLY182g" /LENGTH=140 /DNA_ID=CAMNT_0025520597 /DNA_START=184 /DNA_END=606 /DNA_ORIENTATION=-